MFTIRKTNNKEGSVGSVIFNRWNEVFFGPLEECIKLCAKLNGHTSASEISEGIQDALKKLDEIGIYDLPARSRMCYNEGD